MGWLPPPQEPYPRCRPLGPRLSYPNSKISSDALGDDDDGKEKLKHDIA